MLAQLEICVAGGGSWGTALAHLAASCGHSVRIHLRNEDVCRAINEQHENIRYLPGKKLHPNVRATLDPHALDAEMLILAIPCQQQRSFLTEHLSFIANNPFVINAAKGIELTTLKTCSQFVPELLQTKHIHYAVLSGPSFAKEVMEGQPTAVVIASQDKALAILIQQALSLPFFRCYTSTDVLGVETGGAVKNVIAIAAGLCDGLGIGSNGRAALLTRGLAEISRMGVAMGADQVTFMGLSGLGDLTLTATGNLSRNRQLGLCLGEGLSMEEAAQKIGMVTEGVKTAFAVKKLATDLGISVPITNAVCDILDGTLPAKDAVRQLMTRALRKE